MTSIGSGLSEIETGFAKFLAERWFDGIDHRYRMPNKKGSATHWHRWRVERGDGEIWQATSLSNAADQFAWDDIATSQGRPTSVRCRQAMQSALSLNNSDVIDACEMVFRWGGVGQSSEEWVKTLCNEADQLRHSACETSF